MNLYSVNGKNYNINGESLWNGFILLESDGWFEGIVTDVANISKKNRFIFGVFHFDKIMELYSITSFDIASPLIFHLINSFNGYEGQIEEVDLFENMQYGISCVNIGDYLVNNENKENEIKKLQLNIQNYKDSIMDDDEKFFYSNLFKTRSDLYQTILKQYEKNKIYSKSKRNNF